MSAKVGTGRAQDSRRILVDFSRKNEPARCRRENCPSFQIDMPAAFASPSRTVLTAKCVNLSAEPNVNRITVRYARRKRESHETIRAHQQPPGDPAQVAHESAGI